MRKYFQVYSEELGLLGKIKLIIFVSIVFYFISLVFAMVMVFVIAVGNDFTEFCNSYICFSNFFETMTPVWIFHWSSIQYIAAISSVLGILVAAVTYVSTVGLNKLNSHAINVSSFNQRLALSRKREYELLDISDIDSDRLYNLIYPRSSLGDVSPSEDFLRLLDEYNRSVDAIVPENLNYSLSRHLEFFVEFCDCVGVGVDYPLNSRTYLKIELEVVDFFNRLSLLIYGSRSVKIKGRFLK